MAKLKSNPRTGKTDTDYSATRGKVYKHLRKYEWDYVPPYQYKKAMLRQSKFDDEAKLETYKLQLEYDRYINSLEFNMRYNESVHMDCEDKDVKGPLYMPYNYCDSDNEEKPAPVIDLTSDSENGMDELEYYELVRPNRQQPYDGEPPLQ